MTTAIALAGMSQLAPGDLDPSFGHGGRVVTGVAAGATGRALLLQADGRIVAVGESKEGGGRDFTLARFDTNGDLDPTFGDGDGVVRASPAGERSMAFGGVLQADGKIVAGGQTEGTARFAVARFLPDGHVDPDFGVDGWTLTPIGSAAAARAVAIQSDGKVVLAGTGTAPTGQATFGVARYLLDGTLDLAFGGGDGYASPPIPSGYDDAIGYGMALQGDGKIVVAGRANAGAKPSFALARFWPDGSLDTSFGGDGWVIVSGGSSAGQGRAVALQADGKIVVAGLAISGADTLLAVGRFLTDGSLDPTFGAGGWVATSAGPGDDVANAVLVGPNGRIVAAGSTGSANVDFELVRYRSNGGLDPLFGDGGIVRTSFGTLLDVGSGIARQLDGKLVAVGYRTAGGTNQFALARYLA
jgi:uncharacterized delta-60 repeat protein